jgi:hypothetical protein
MPFDLVLRRFILLGAPFALAVLLLFHPWPYDDYSNELVPIAGWWIALHTVAFVLLAFMGAAVWLLTDRLQGADVFISRLGAVVFVIFYNIGDAVAGISTGILARAAADAPPGERDALVESIGILFADPIKNLSFEIGFYAWIGALFAAAVALYRAGAPRSPLLLFAPAAYFLTGDHAVPFGSLAFGSFFLGVLWLEFAWRAPGRAESPLVRSTVSDPR